MTSRRHFISKTSQAAAGLYLGSLGFSAKSYGRILGANDRVRVGVVGFSDRHKSSHMPCFLNHYKELNFDIVAVSDIWNKRREEGMAAWKVIWPRSYAKICEENVDPCVWQIATIA